MSKVVHLSDDAHNNAKQFCREHDLKMSDWVATLINLAVRGEKLSAAASIVAAANLRTLVEKKKLVEPSDIPSQTDAEGLPVYSAPPFWAQANEH